MRLLFLSKRRPLQRDLIARPYGRFYHLPSRLARRGHEVTVLVLSYRWEPSLFLRRDGVTWLSAGPSAWGGLGYLARALRVMREMRPDWVIGVSDTYFGILATWLAERFQGASLIDAYDNFESYLPGFTWLHRRWRAALARANAVTAAGPHLAEHLARFRPGKAVAVVPMAADPEFTPLDRGACRRQLGLHPERPLVGYTGSLYRNRGIELLNGLAEQLRGAPEVELVLAGRVQRGVTWPKTAKWLGYLEDDRLPILVNSLDVQLVVNRRSSFGEFSYPVKLYEAMRCGIPVVASDVPGVRWVLRDHPDFLVRPEAGAFAAQVRVALSLGRVDYQAVNDWERSTDLFEHVLQEGGS
jgi:glycosyltransferase involved in cell wall biosynthesis